jgi:hypothetical protein
MVPEISGITNCQENERVHAWFYTEPAPESGLSDADFQTKRIAWSTRISIFLDHFWVNNRFSEQFFWKPTFLDGSKTTSFIQFLSMSAKNWDIGDGLPMSLSLRFPLPTLYLLCSTRPEMVKQC